MTNCPLALPVGCQYGVNLECPNDYESCTFYQLNERQRLSNELTMIQLTASELEQSLIKQELDLWKELRER